MGKTPPFRMVRREAVCYMWSHAMEFSWVRLSLSNGQERSGLQYLESCTGVFVGETPHLLKGSRESVCNI